MELVLRWVFCTDIWTGCDFCFVHHWLIGFYNRCGKCLLRGTDWFVFERLILEVYTLAPWFCNSRTSSSWLQKAADLSDVETFLFTPFTLAVWFGSCRIISTWPLWAEVFSVVICTFPNSPMFQQLSDNNHVAFWSCWVERNGTKFIYTIHTSFPW